MTTTATYDSNTGFEAEDTPDGAMGLAEYRSILEEIEQQPRNWRSTADKEMDYADGNQLDTEILKAQAALGIPPAMENLISASLEGIRGYEQSTRTDWRVTPNGQPEGQDVADAISFKLNEAERHSKADDACGEAFYPQIGVGIGWVEVARNDDPFQYPFRCTSIHRNEIHWDWHAKELDLSDARYLRRQRWLHPSRLMRVFPEHAELIRRFGKHGINWWNEYTDELDHGGASTGLNRAWDVARDWTVMEDRWYNPLTSEICVSELWYRRWVNIVVLKSPDGRIVEFEESNPAHVMAVNQRLVQFQRKTVARVRRSYWLGPHCLFDGPTPYTHRFFPYVPFWGFREDNSRVPYGYIRNMLYQQDTLNSGTSRLRWGMSAYRVERTEDAVAMPDEIFRRTVGRLDADIKLNKEEMASGGIFKVERDFQMNEQQLHMLDNARNAIERINPAAAGAFSGRRGTATSGVQEQTQVEQANQSLSFMVGNFKRSRMQVGELLMAMIVQDMGKEQQTIVIEGDAVRADRTVVINRQEVDPATGTPYLSNDLQRTRLMVGLEDVPSSTTYRGQQLNALSEAIKSLPSQYQAAAMPFLASLMDVPFKRDLVEALRAAGQQESPEQVEQRIKKEVQDALAKAGNDLKARELDLKERLTDAQIKQIMAQAVQTGVQAAFSAMQGGAQVAQMPMIAPIADAIMQGAGYQKPNPVGDDPNFPTPEEAAAMEMRHPYVQGRGTEPGSEQLPDIAQVHQNTSPAFPPVPQQAPTGQQGIETPSTSDNLQA